MVKKLIKHEFISYLRSLLPIELALIGIATVLRFIQIFENETTGYSILFGSAVFAFVAAIIVCLVMTFIVSIQRYYKNLFKAEGYLTFTLPVTHSQHIFTKVLCAVSVTLVTLINVFVSVCIATAGEFCVEIFKAIGYILSHISKYIGAANVTFYIIEFIILFVVALFTEYLLFYACITLGQTAKKNRVAAAVGIYFGYYYATQIFATIAIMIFSSINFSYEFLEMLEDFVTKNAKGLVHGGFALGIIITALMGFVYYIISLKVMKKKLNIE